MKRPCSTCSRSAARRIRSRPSYGRAGRPIREVSWGDHCGERHLHFPPHVRPPVQPCVGRFSRHPRPVAARARHRPVRKQPPRDAGAAQLCDRQSRRLGGLWQGRLGAHRVRRAGRFQARRSAASSASSSATRRAGRASATTARWRRPRSAGRSRSSRGWSSEALAAMHRRYGAAIYGQYGFFDSFNPTLPIAPVAGQAPAPRADRPGAVLGRRRLSRHRPGADRGDDRQPARRVRVEARCGAVAPVVDRLAPRRLQRRLAGRRA